MAFLPRSGLNAPSSDKASGLAAPRQYGLIAEEVADIAPDLVASNKDGESRSSATTRSTPSSLNEVQKLHRENGAQKQEFAETLRKPESLLSDLENRAK